jgi:septal ring factor EnvC (AmiA/AmiB activator)
VTEDILFDADSLSIEQLEGDIKRLEEQLQTAHHQLTAGRASEAELRQEWLDLKGQLETTRSALHDLAEECFERMAAADLDAWDAPYRIEYPGDLVERARAVLNPASEPAAS